eukprot:12377304-Alexandrium_andersonii.AAC.1
MKHGSSDTQPSAAQAPGCPYHSRTGFSGRQPQDGKQLAYIAAMSVSKTAQDCVGHVQPL